MSVKSQIIKNKRDLEKEKENSKNKTDNSHSFNIKTFWNNINEYNFSNNLKLNPYEINHLISLFSQHVPEKDLIYSETGFPKNLLTFAGKYYEQNIKKNNPQFITKLFGCNVYLDKSDWLLHNNNDDNFINEINFLENKVFHLEQNNLNNLSKIKLISEIKKNSFVKEEVNLDSPEIKQEKYDNLINQIYNLQMKQFAESICGIKKENNQNNYIIIFDPTENIQSIKLSEKEYLDFIHFRDPLNSISIYDLFQEKTHLYYNTGSNNKINLKSNFKKEDFQVAKKIQIKYYYCHHCKQRKPSEVIFQCKSHLIGNKMCQRPNKNFIVNGTSVVRKYKSLIIRDFEGNINEFIEVIKNNDNINQCKRYFCNFCLKGSYDTLLEDIKNKNDWLCPFCLGQCFCTRCTRNDKILKLIAYYISIKGDINILYDALIIKNRIFDILHKNLVISNILYIVNNHNSNPDKMIKDIINPGNEKNLKDIIDKYYDLKDNLVNVKNYINNLFIQSKIDKSLLFYQKNNIKVKNDLIGKKRYLNFDDYDFDIINKERERDTDNSNDNENLTNETDDGKIKTSKLYFTRSGLNK